jgi:prophage maintenance system killer protein
MSTESQPYQECFGRELYPSLAAKAAYIFYHLATGHVFSNGNKRTAALCLDSFLLANSRYLTLSNDEVHDLAQSVASSGENGERFEDVLARITTLVEANNIPLSSLRAVDMSAYRSLHRGKNLIRKLIASAAGRPLFRRT